MLFRSDYVPPTLGDLLTAADVAMLRPPSALWGYNPQVTDDALSRIAQIVTERDVEIAVLRQQLADLRSGTGGTPAVAAVARTPEPVAPEPVAPEPVTAESAADEPAAAAPEPAAPESAADAAVPDHTPPPAVPSDEAAAPGDD